VTLTDIVRELAYPLTQPVILIALLFFWLLMALANYAGLLGLFLLIVLLPAYFRYLLDILEARAHARQPEPPSIEIFSLVDSLWTLFPLLPVAALIWSRHYLGGGESADAMTQLIAALPLLAFLLLMPASLTILVLTRSPLASLNPVSILAVMRRSMPGYLLIPLLIFAVSAGLHGLRLAGVPPLLLDLAGSYQMVLFCSLTGAVMFRNAIHLEVDIPSSPTEDAAAVIGRQLLERQAVASHAYGFISRGNREGGLKHVQDRIGEEADVDGAYEWFFNELMRWESSDAVLYFAQTYLSRLLRMDQDPVAIKVLSRCLHRNPRFVPLQQDRDLTLNLLKKYRREDLLASLANNGMTS